jgi:hypothetical protein
MDLHVEGNRLVTDNFENWIVMGSIIESQGVRYIVDKVNPKNYLCYDERGGCWNIRRTPNVKALPRDTVFDKTAYLTKKQQQRERDRQNRNEAMTSTLVLGSTVRFKNEKDRKKFPDTYVVCIIPNAKGNVRLAKLGGDNNRYVNAHFSLLEEVNL